MKHRKRNLVAAISAAVLLTVTAFGSVTLAHDGPRDRRDPSASPTPRATQKALPSRTPRADLKIDCSKIPAASPTASATPDETAGSTASPAARVIAGWGFFGREWPATFARDWEAICSLASVKSSLTGQLDGLIRQLQALNTAVARSSLTEADKATLKAEIDAAIADVTALKNEIAGTTTVASAQGYAGRVRALIKEVRGVRVQVQTILGSLRVLASVAKLENQIDAFQARIDAAPSGIDTALAQRYLDDMKARVADAVALAGPLRARLIAITLDQIKSGAAYPTLAAGVTALRSSIWDVWRAMWDARTITWILAGKPGFEGHQKPSASPSASPTVTPVPTPVPTA